MPVPRFLKGRVAQEEAVLVGDSRVEGWESVSTFADQKTAVAWRDQLRSMGVDASCVADHPIIRSTASVAGTSTSWSRQSNGPAPARSLTTSSEPHRTGPSDSLAPPTVGVVDAVPGMPARSKLGPWR
jgi:hypothetical protein